MFVISASIPAVPQRMPMRRPALWAGRSSVAYWPAVATSATFGGPSDVAAASGVIILEGVTKRIVTR